jgi:hypothetical protein
MSRAIHHGSMLWFECPGCRNSHAIAVDGSRGWRWNGSLDRPTVLPSILVYANPVRPDSLPGYKGTPRCHSFVTDGRIQFLDDCTHDLKGQTVDLPECSE